MIVICKTKLVWWHAGAPLCPTITYLSSVVTIIVYLASENHPKGNEDRENVLILVYLLDWIMIS